MNKSERKRMLCVSLAAGAILLCGVLLVLLMRYQHTSTVRPQDQYVGQIPAFYSTVDADGDGVDDQTDVLDNALAYVDTRPKYKSRYYQTGYPDDGYGVCTDVVAFALKMPDMICRRWWTPISGSIRRGTISGSRMPTLIFAG